MAKQSGIMPLQGSLDNYTFFKSKDGFKVRKRVILSAERIATDPDFQRTRENNAEFGRATKAAKLLRVAVRNSIVKVKDGRMVSRLSTAMLKVVKADATSDRGQRNVIDGEAGLLQGFEFNIGATLSATMCAPYSVVFDREKGEATVSVAGFIPLNMIVAPFGATHFGLFASLSSVDFEGETNDTVMASTKELPYNNAATEEIKLTLTIKGGSTHPVFILLGVEYMQEVNGKMYPLKNGAFNACSITKVDSPV